MNLFGLTQPKAETPIQKSGNITQKFAIEFKTKNRFIDGYNCRTFITPKITASKSCLFIGQQSLTIDEARPLIQNCLKGLFEKLKPNQEDVECQDLIKYVTVRMNFWDQDWNRRKPPYIAEIHAGRGTIKYFQSNPETQELILLLEEPYQPQTQPTE